MADRTDRNHQVLQDALVFMLLIAIGVVGRWGQPDWCFTPAAAVAVFAGFYFSRIAIGLLVPLAVLGISDLALPAYDSRGVMVAVHVSLAFPVLLGWALRRPSGPLASAVKFGMCGLLPASLFFLVSNWAVWQFRSDYEATLAGLAACYTAALPFYRTMLMGDVFYLAVFFGCLLAANSYLHRPVLQTAAPRPSRT